MPGGDRTGPMGTGPMTGRGAGICAGYDVPGYDVPGYLNSGFGCGFGHGRGRGLGRGFGMGGGRGRRHQYYATGLPRWARGNAYSYVNRPGIAAASVRIPTSKAARNEELAYLKEQARYLKEAMEDIESRVRELQPETDNITNTQEKE
jgi:hypothetical protein